MKRQRKWIVLLAVCIGLSGCRTTKKAVKQQPAKSAVEEKQETAMEVEEEKPEDEVYSYLQGIKSYEKGEEWAGPWCYEEAGNQQFSQFGCGLCSLANIYSTLGKEICTPLEIYERAQEVTPYYPQGGAGAIGWDCIRITLQKSGFTCQLGRKPEDYASFQELAEAGECLMVLISSENDDSYWKEVPGHYVTLWLYNEETDKVFLADSSGPSRNRKWIPLRYVYDALKTSSPQQYLLVEGYDAAADGWDLRDGEGT